MKLITKYELTESDIKEAISFWLDAQGKGKPKDISFQSNVIYGYGDVSLGNVISAVATAADAEDDRDD